MQNKIHLVLYTRNLIFGAEDSLVSTVGLLSGVAVGGVDRGAIVLTGIVLVFVEAFSMGVGSYLSEYSSEESTAGPGFQTTSTIRAALIMFGSYFLSGFIPLWPYLFFENSAALPISIISSLLGLFILGYISARILHIRIWKSAVRMTTIGGLAILIGMMVGKLIGV